MARVQTKCLVCGFIRLRDMKNQPKFLYNSEYCLRCNELVYTKILNMGIVV